MKTVKTNDLGSVFNSSKNINNETKGLVPHQWEQEEESCLYMVTWYHVLNSLEREEASLYAPLPPSGRLGVGLLLVEGFRSNKILFEPI